MNPLHEMIRRLPPRVEFLVVVSWAFGLPIFSSILSLGASRIDASQPYVTNAGLIGLLVVELLQSLFLIWFLRIRGWTPSKLGLQITWRGTLLGVALLLVTYTVLIAVNFIAGELLPIDMTVAMARYPTAADDLNMQVVFLVSAVNGIFEEVFVAGYIITALSQLRGPWMGINVSTGIRLLCHLYQGPIGVLYVVPFGLLFGYAYVRTRQLWPLIFAHVVIDIIGLSMPR